MEYRPPYFFRGRKSEVFSARWKTTSRRSTDRRNRGLNLSNLWLDDDSALIPDSSLTLAGGKLRLMPALHRAQRRSTDECGLTPIWNTRKSMLVAGFSQFNKDTSFFCSGLPQPRIWGNGATDSVRDPGLVSLWAALDSSRLWRVLGRPLDPPGTRALCGRLRGALNMGLHSLVKLMSCLHAPLKPASDFRHVAVWSAESKCHHESA